MEQAHIHVERARIQLERHMDIGPRATALKNTTSSPPSSHHPLSLCRFLWANEARGFEYTIYRDIISLRVHHVHFEHIPSHV